MDEYRLADTLTSIRNVSNWNRGYYEGRETEQQKPFNLFLTYHHVSDTLWDIPITISNFVVGAIQEGRLLLGATVKAPLSYVSDLRYIETYRGGESLFHNLMPYGHANWKLYKVKDPSGNLYYGGAGLILDSNFEPIVMFCKRVNVQDIVIERNSSEIILKINRNIFDNSTRLLEKFILNKVVPISMAHNCVNRIEYCNLRGIIQTPNCDSTSNEALNACLEENLEALIEDV